MGALVLLPWEAPPDADPELHEFDTALRRACRDGGLKLPAEPFDSIPLESLTVSDVRPVGIEALLENGVPEPQARRVVLLCSVLARAAFVVTAAATSRARGPDRAKEELQASRAKSAAAALASGPCAVALAVAHHKAPQGYGALALDTGPVLRLSLLDIANEARRALAGPSEPVALIAAG